MAELLVAHFHRYRHNGLRSKDLVQDRKGASLH